MKLVVGLFGLLFATSTFAASFDCSKAASVIELKICASPNLSLLDEQLALAYREALATTTDPRSLKDEQSAWLKQIRNQCQEADCIEELYKTRITALVDYSTEKIVIANDRPENIQSDVRTPEQPQIVTQEDSQQQVSPIEQATPQTNPIVTTEQNIALANPNAAGVAPDNHSVFKLTSLQAKLIGLALLVNILLTIYFHKSERLIIYNDYTDAAFTGLAPLLAIVAYFLFFFFEVPTNIAQKIVFGFFAIMMIFVIKNTAKHNKGVSIFFVMSLITKVTIVGLYYAIMAMLIFGSGSARKKGESYAAFEARKRREAKANAAAMALTTAGFVALSAWVCRHAEFSPPGEYFSIREGSA